MTGGSANDHVDRSAHKLKQLPALKIANVCLHDAGADMIVPITGSCVGVELDASNDVETGGCKPGGEAAGACI